MPGRSSRQRGSGSVRKHFASGLPATWSGFASGRPLTTARAGAGRREGLCAHGCAQDFLHRGRDAPAHTGSSIWSQRLSRASCLRSLPFPGPPVQVCAAMLSPRARSPLLGDFGFSGLCGNPARLGRGTTHGSGGPGCARGKSKGLSSIWRVNQVRSELLRVVRRYCFQRGTHEGCTTRASGRAQSRGRGSPGRETAPTCRR